MGVFLLDINVLMAMAWPNHDHHKAVLDWWAGKAGDQWSTCPMTQCGLVRLSCNPKVMPGAKTVAEAFKLLDRIMATPRHIFWEDDFTLSDPRFVSKNRIQGYRQITDVYLLGLSIRRGGQFATFDNGVPGLTSKHDAVVRIPK